MPSTATSILDGLSTSVAVKAPVKAASTANLALSGEQTIDGVACVEGDRVLVKNQSTASENGIYVVSTGSWTRAKDFDGNRDVRQGTLVVLGVTGSSGIYYRVTSNNPITIGTSSINFEIVGGSLTQSIIADLLFPYDGEIIAGTEPTTATARFYAVEAIDAHAHYGFLDESLIEYAGGAPIYGHASFNDNVTFTGSVASDHHHSFQSYPHYDVSATITRIAGFYSIGDVTDGTVTSYAGLWVDDPTGAGTITNLYGVYVNELDRGTGNSYAFFSEGQTKSCFGGPLQLGSPATPAIVQYEYVSGNLELIARTGFKIHAKGILLIGNASEAQSASLESDGDLTITPRTGFNTVVDSPLEATGPVTLPSYTVAQLGSAVLPGDWPRAWVYVSNEAGGAVMAFSDGTNWRRCTDRAVVS